MIGRTVRASAPASIGNVAVGFDILGCALDVARDEVTATSLESQDPVTIVEITGTDKPLPFDQQKNTAAVAALSLLKAAGFPFAVQLKIHKGIPLSAGMGGSAASAVAAVVAVNALLPQPFSQEELLPFALAGEAIASGSLHADNVAPSLLGGIKLILSSEEIYNIPIPESLYCVLVHPELEVETKSARSILKNEISLKSYVQQSALLAGFIHSCHTGDFKLMKRSLRDTLIEPQRAPLIRGFSEAKAAALTAGALGFSISGAGPSVFAFAASKEEAQKIAHSIKVAFQSVELNSEGWIAPISQKGAQILSKAES